jgi:hypothetical protein
VCISLTICLFLRSYPMMMPLLVSICDQIATTFEMVPSFLVIRLSLLTTHTHTSTLARTLTPTLLMPRRSTDVHYWQLFAHPNDNYIYTRQKANVVEMVRATGDKLKVKAKEMLKAKLKSFHVIKWHFLFFFVHQHKLSIAAGLTVISKRPIRRIDREETLHSTSEFLLFNIFYLISFKRK